MVQNAKPLSTILLVPGGKIISHVLWSFTSSTSEMRAANKSVANVVRPVPGIVHAIHLCVHACVSVRACACMSARMRVCAYVCVREDDT